MATYFWQITRLAVLRQFSYKAATLAGLATNLFFGLLRAALMTALYGSQIEVAGYSLRDGITFTGISQAVIGCLAFFSWLDLMRSVYSGQVGADLLKPVSFYHYWLAQDLGRALVALLTRGLPVMICYALIFDIAFPTTPGQWFVLILTLALAWLVSF